jgi:hypothetical protein
VVTAWREFLSRRYTSISAFNSVHGTTHREFDQIAWPQALPSGVLPLRDWYEFSGIVLAARGSAHRFTVLLPAVRGGTFADAGEIRRKEIAERVVEIEKPAHTTFDVKYYWSQFRIGFARLGSDTALEYGSDDQRLLRPAVVEESYVGEAYLATRNLPRMRERQILNEGRCRSERESS